VSRPEAHGRLVIGLTGPNAAGKGVVANLLLETGYAYHSLSDIVREVARASGLDTSRRHLIEMGQRLRREEGPGVLASRLMPRLEPPAVVDSVRHPAEVTAFRSLPAFRLLGVDAPLEVRYERAVARDREGDRPDLETFRRREEQENASRPEAQQLRKTLALADEVVSNEGSIEALHRAVRAIVDRWERAAAAR
jgi:dephospho-CoA kinase